MAGWAYAVELPVPEKLERDFGVRRAAVTVVEPHESNADRQVTVSYVGFTMETLLTRWFGADWQAPDAEVVFLARDGYRSAIASSRLKQFQAYLAFGRDDGQAFVVDNPSQNERRIPLGPYYLIWDNRAVPELLRQGTHGWPYQVTRIELHSTAGDRGLLPAHPSEEQQQGFTDAKEYCLTCHRIRGVGGDKNPADLVQSSCVWKDADLKTWIQDPNRLRPGTSMPPLDPMLPAEERQRIAERIVAYLRSVNPSTCAGGASRP